MQLRNVAGKRTEVKDCKRMTVLRRVSVMYAISGGVTWLVHTFVKTPPNKLF